MDEQKSLQKLEDYARTGMQADSTGHDWWHTNRVRRTALDLAAAEPEADLFVVEAAALLHDVYDHKLGYSDAEREEKLNGLLQSLTVEPQRREHIIAIIQHLSYKSGTNNYKMRSIEGRIVQDADRLDAIGAVGIARAFAYGGSKNRPLFDPEATAFQEQGTIGHFYEKLLLLKDKMNTEAGRTMAEVRHQRLEQFLADFFEEWNGRM